MSQQPLLKGFALGIVMPAGGFMVDAPYSIIYCAIGLIAYVLSLFLWVATGNVIVVVLSWLVTALFAGVYQQYYLVYITPINTQLVFSLPIVAIGIVFLRYQYYLRKALIKRVRTQQQLSQTTTIQSTQSQATKVQSDELSPADLAQMRLLLDRALQPVAQFNGFESIEQFQTAALRYQVNAISYALSCAQHCYLPAMSGYLTQAQENLRLKQMHYRLWRYWQWENLWGNFRHDADPIKRDNIMYSGFVAAQLAYAYQSRSDTIQGLHCAHPNGMRYVYTFSEIIQTLATQYQQADLGLLPCEPNWIYPLCNLITATAIRKHDVIFGTDCWQQIEANFFHALETEFMTTDGQFVPFRSSYTGLAAPQLGGLVMQAFPCVFLNALRPELARRQWNIVKQQLGSTEKSWRHKLWPVDVGNYGFSRASSYAATAFAARELGDNETAEMLLSALDTSSPPYTNAGVQHHTNASLWANAYAFMAQINQPNTMYEIVNTVSSAKVDSPYLDYVDYEHIIVAKASVSDRVLHLVLYPAKPQSKQSTIQIRGLKPYARYRIKGLIMQSLQATQEGSASITLQLKHRTSIHITPID